jgi:diguanylate cyclase (GGDEF)-like protein/PAS domain S-box-containing protein
MLTGVLRTAFVSAQGFAGLAGGVSHGDGGRSAEAATLAPGAVIKLASAAVLGLGLLGLTSTGVWLAGRLFQVQSVTTSLEIAVAHRQVALVERITGHARDILLNRGLRDWSQAQMSACAEALMSGHKALRSGDSIALQTVIDKPIECGADSLGMRRVEVQKLAMPTWPAAFDIGSLESTLRRFVASTHIIASKVLTEGTTHPRLIEIVELGTTELPIKLEALVADIHAETRRKAEHWQSVSDIALLVVYLVLVTFWATFLRPMAKSARRAYAALEEKNDLLAERQQDLQDAYDQLAETAAQFKSLSNLSADWYWRLTDDHRLAEVSEAADRSGLAPTKLIGQRIEDLIDRAAPESHEELTLLLAARRSFRSFEFRLSEAIAGDSDRWVSLSGEPIYSPNGEFRGWRGVGRDITRRRRTVQSLAETKARLEAFVQAAPAPIAMLDRDMRYVVHTRAWLSAYEFPDESLVGRSHYDVFPDLPESWKDVHRRCLAGDVACFPNTRIETPSGRQLIVRRELRPWYDASGAICGLMILNDDITSVAHAMEAARTSEERFRLLFDVAPVGLCLSDPADGTILLASRTMSEMSGYTAEELTEFRLSDVTQRDLDATQLPEAIEIRRKDGGTTPAVVSTHVFTDPAGRTLCLSAMQDLTWRRESEQRLWRTAHIDPLTGLHNRHWLTAELTRHFDLSQGADQGLAVCIVDVDDFKAINDTAGHATGDALLVALAARLSASLSDGDLAARVGGDEFALVLKNVMTSAAVEDRLLAIRAAIAEPFEIDGLTHPASASLGSARAPRDGSTAEALLTSADIALHRAKTLGRGQHVAFEPAFREALQNRVRTSADVVTAIEKGEMALHYQPIVHAATTEPAGFEALLRWNHPERGLLAPGAFVTALDDPRAASAIGRYVIETSFAQAADWRRRNVPFDKISINLATADFHSGQLVETLQAALAKHQISPDCIGLEITENIFLGSASDEVERTLRHLRRIGFEIAFDDFGTGYASLTHLRRFPIDRIKIDRSFVSAITTDAGDRAIVCAMIAMAHGLGLRVTAEGIDQPATLELLSRLGCHEAQGYLLGRPMPAEEAESHLVRGTASRSLQRTASRP